MDPNRIMLNLKQKINVGEFACTKIVIFAPVSQITLTVRNLHLLGEGTSHVCDKQVFVIERKTFIFVELLCYTL